MTQYAFMVWRLVKAHGQFNLLPFSAYIYIYLFIYL